MAVEIVENGALSPWFEPYCQQVVEAKEKIKKKNLRNNSFKSSVSARSTFPLYTRKPQRILTLTLSLVAPALCTKSIDTPCLSGVEDQVFCPSPCKKGYRFNTYCRSRGVLY
ncbi:unnamed protein product [Coffea canephora]|uniref:Uncharacterized protein n=1 Tax=Coffea canephora TaxID=49390 RepID=A0A068VA25_COFCA|nr:unnamed protein product [Coffea canephora]